MGTIDSTATTPQEVDEARWRQSSFCFKTLERMFSNPVVQLPAPDTQSITGYFFKRLPRLDPKTRTNIIAILTSLMHPFMRGYLRELFCTTTNLLLEMTHEGAIIVLDLPIKAHSEAGILAQHIWKYLWQWADECQFFLSEYDAEFRSTARSSRELTVYLTQSLPTVHAWMNGRMPEKTADALLANFQPKLFHANSCPITNQWAADMIGKVWPWVATHGSNEGWSESEGMNVNRGSSSTSSDRGNGFFSLQWGWGKNRSNSRSGGSSSSRSQHLDHEVLPSAFTRLGKGGGMGMGVMMGPAQMGFDLYRDSLFRMGTMIDAGIASRLIQSPIDVLGPLRP